MPGVEHRSLTPFLQKFREVLRGRKVVESLRYADCLAARTQPPPEVPGGPFHKLSGVYYFPRDVRRMVQPPVEVLTHKRLETGKSLSSEVPPITPAKLYSPK